MAAITTDAKIATMPSPPRRWPTQASAKLTMRLEMPPAFISSPASMKKGIASKGKLSAPSTSFCDRMVVSIWPWVTIRAAPQTSSEKAIGRPSAMAPKSVTAKMATVMAWPR